MSMAVRREETEGGAGRESTRAIACRACGAAVRETVVDLGLVPLSPKLLAW